MNNTETTNERQNKVILVINGREDVVDQTALGVTMDSSEQEILDAVQGMISESLRDSDNHYSYTVRKTTNTNNIMVYPKPVAG